MDDWRAGDLDDPMTDGMEETGLDMGLDGADVEEFGAAEAELDDLDLDTDELALSAEEMESVREAAHRQLDRDASL